MCAGARAARTHPERPDRLLFQRVCRVALVGGGLCPRSAQPTPIAHAGARVVLGSVALVVRAEEPLPIQHGFHRCESAPNGAVRVFERLQESAEGEQELGGPFEVLAAKGECLVDVLVGVAHDEERQVDLLHVPFSDEPRQPAYHPLRFVVAGAVALDVKRGGKAAAHGPAPVGTPVGVCDERASNALDVHIGVALEALVEHVEMVLALRACVHGHQQHTQMEQSLAQALEPCAG